MAPTAVTAAATTALLLLLLLSAPATAHNITKILESFPELSTFNSLLNQSGVAKQVNSRRTITVLAFDNGAAGAISGQPEEALAHILSVHVILDYYDSKKIAGANKQSVIVTTLFQSSGVAPGRTGFLNMTSKGGKVGFGSAVPGAGITANLVKEIYTNPYNISVLQISGAIYPPGIGGIIPPPPPPAAPAAPPPAKAANVPAPAEAPEADAPAADAPEAVSPAADAPAPASASSPTPAAADAVEPPAEKETGKSSAGAVAVGKSIAVAAMGAAFLAAL